MSSLTPIPGFRQRGLPDGELPSLELSNRPTIRGKNSKSGSEESLDKIINSLFDFSMEELSDEEEVPVTVVPARPTVLKPEAAKPQFQFAQYGGAAAILERSSPEEKLEWKEAFNQWKSSHPRGSEEMFAQHLLETKGIHQDTPTRLKFASVIFLGDRTYRTLPNGSKITVMLGKPKPGRAAKVTIYTDNMAHIAQGGQNTAEKCKGIAIALREGVVTTKVEKEYVHRLALKPSKNPEAEDVGNKTLVEIKKRVTARIQEGGAVPPWLELTGKGEVVGIQKPGKEISKENSYEDLMELGSFKSWMERTSPSVEDVLRAFSGPMKGLGATIYAHAIHTDLKPANILLDKNGNGVISDWSDVVIGDPIPKNATPEKTLEISKNNPIGFNTMSFTPSYNFFYDIDILNNKEELIETTEIALTSALRQKAEM